MNFEVDISKITNFVLYNYNCNTMLLGRVYLPYIVILFYCQLFLGFNNSSLIFMFLPLDLFLQKYERKKIAGMSVKQITCSSLRLFS